MSENGEIYTAGKKFTLPPAVTALTNSTSGVQFLDLFQISDIQSSLQLEYYLALTAW